MKAALCLVTLLPSIALAQRLELFADINSGCQSAACASVGSTQFMGAQGAFAVFGANDGFSGSELWVTDGTMLGTRLLVELKPGPLGSMPDSFRAQGGLVYFVADDGVAGFELWRTDGTVMGTFRLKDILPGTPSGFLNYVGTLGTRMVFSATEGDGYEPWITDGTVAGTTKLADITLAIPGSRPTGGVEVNGTLYFLATNAANDRVVFRSTGTGAIESIPRLMCEPTRLFPVGLAGTTMYFSTNCNQLWRYDGTIPTLVGAYVIQDLVVMNNEAFYLGSGPMTFGLHRLSSSLFIPERLDFDDGFTGQPANLMVVNGQLAFIKVGSGGFGRWWTSDGTVMGTRPAVTFVNDGTAAVAPAPVAFGSTVIWSGALSPTSPALYRSDFTDAGTFTVWPQSGAGLSMSSRVAFDAGVLVFINDGVTGVEPWVTDGTAQGTKQLRDINIASGSSSPSDFTATDGGIFFVADDGRTGRDLYFTTGLDGGATRLTDLRAGPASGNPRRLLVTDAGLFFIANDTETNVSMYKYTWGPGAQRLYDFTADASTVLAFGQGLAYPLYHPNTGIELGIVDGLGRERIIDLLPGTTSSEPMDLLATSSGLYFSAAVVGGRELWRTDGTDAGTERYDDLCSGACDANPTPLAETPFGIAVAGFAPITGRELYVTTPIGNLRLVADIEPGPNDSNPRDGLRHRNGLYFSATRVLEGRELWFSDGTPAGTRVIADLQPGLGGSNPRDLVALDDTRVLFTAETVFSGRELWVTDGTGGGTRQLADFAPGMASSNPRVLAVRHGVAFVSLDSAGGRELWRTDGVDSRLLVDIIQGDGGSNPTEAAWLDQALIVAASGPIQGAELWRVTDPSPPSITPFVIGTQGDQGWYVSDVTVRFAVNEDFFLEQKSGCDEVLVQTDTPDASITCAATSPGGTQSVTVRFRRDTVPPAAPTITAPTAETDVTSMERFAVTGSAEPGLRLGVFVGAAGTPSCTTTSSNTGAWSCDIVTASLDAGRLPLAAEAKDEAGNPARSQAVFVRVTRADSMPPQLSCPSNQFLPARPEGTLLLAYTARAIDDRDPSPRIESTPAAGAALPVGTHSVEVRAIDATGNQSSCTFTVTVVPAGATTDAGMEPGPVEPPKKPCGCQGAGEGMVAWALVLWARRRFIRAR